MKKSHELIQLEICERRGIILDNEAKKRLYSLSKGFEGERLVYEWFEEIIDSNTQLISDYWFHHGKNMQVDLLVIINNKWLVVEVKNYFGKFEYKNNECYLNGKLMGDNHFTQLFHRTRRIQHIAAKLHTDIEVNSVMVFIGEHCEVDIESEIAIKVVLRNQLKYFINSIVNESRYERPHCSKKEVTEVLNKYKVQSPYQPLLFSENKVNREMRKGITCARCQSYNTYATQKNIKCKVCSHVEQKRSTVLRTALELQYLYYYNPEKITSQKIYDVCGGVISRGFIYKTLGTNYKRIDKGPRTHYVISKIER